MPLPSHLLACLTLHKLFHSALLSCLTAAVIQSRCSNYNPFIFLLTLLLLFVLTVSTGHSSILIHSFQIHNPHYYLYFDKLFLSLFCLLTDKMNGLFLFPTLRDCNVQQILCNKCFCYYSQIIPPRDGVVTTVLLIS